MKVGDLVRLYSSLRDRPVGIIVEVTEWATLVQWLDDGCIEDIENYVQEAEVEVVSESR